MRRIPPQVPRGELTRSEHMVEMTRQKCPASIRRIACVSDTFADRESDGIVGEPRRTGGHLVNYAVAPVDGANQLRPEDGPGIFEVPDLKLPTARSVTDGLLIRALVTLTFIPMLCAMPEALSERGTGGPPQPVEGC